MNVKHLKPKRNIYKILMNNNKAQINPKQEAIKYYYPLMSTIVL